LPLRQGQKVNGYMGNGIVARDAGTGEAIAGRKFKSNLLFQAWFAPRQMVISLDSPKFLP
jgi:hypothetical protein